MDLLLGAALVLWLSVLQGAAEFTEVNRGFCSSSSGRIGWGFGGVRAGRCLWDVHSSVIIFLLSFFNTCFNQECPDSSFSEYKNFSLGTELELNIT